MGTPITAVAVALCALGLVACEYAPSIDANGFACKSTADCPPSYQCVNATPGNPGVCCNSPEAGLCSARDAGRPPTGLDGSDSRAAAPDEGTPPGRDGASDGSAVDDGGADRRTEAPTDGPVDAPRATDATDVPLTSGATDLAADLATDLAADLATDLAADLAVDIGVGTLSDAPGGGTGGASGSGGQVDGGGSGGAGGADGATSVAPTVLSVNPAAGTTDVSPSVVISATFSAPMAPTTFTPTSFVVRRGTTTLAGAVAVTGSTATFTPTRPLVLAGAYQATISAGVKDATGAPMAADHTWTFTARDGVFSASRAISAIGHNTYPPVLAANAGGDAMAAWQQFDDPTHGRTYAAQFAPASGWFAPALVDTTDLSSTSPSLALGEDGSALVAFTTPAGAASSRFTPATGWSAPIALAPQTLNLSLAMDGAGRAVAAYEAGGVNAKGFTVATGWGTEQMLSGNAIFPQVALTSAGTGIASFNALLAAGEQVYVARYNGTAWLTAEPISAATATIGNFSAAAIDSAGVPVVLWCDNRQAYASRFVGGAWGAAQAVGPAPDNGEVIGLSQGPTDTLVAVMSTSEGSQPAEVWANVLADGAWRTAKKLTVIDTPILGGPAAAVAPNGNAMVVWLQGGAVWVARQIEGTGWTLGQKLPDGAAATTVGAARVRIDASGRATIVFSAADTATTTHVRAIRFE